eukprot:291410-Hanusia_phi.AAC.1
MLRYREDDMKTNRSMLSSPSNELFSRLADMLKHLHSQHDRRLKGFDTATHCKIMLDMIESDEELLSFAVFIAAVWLIHALACQ